MAGEFYVDGIDIYKQFGIFVTENGYDELIAYASLKGVESNNWFEYDGEEYDLSSPKLDGKELSIPFAVSGGYENINAFVAMLSKPAYHIFDFRQFGKTYKLRLVSQPQMRYGTRKLSLFTLRFSDDFPLRDYTYVAPDSEMAIQQGYTLDDKSLSNYGITILNDSNSDIIKTPDMKGGLTRNIKTMSGIIYDNFSVATFESKNLKLDCLLCANTPTEFWRNYDAFLFDLIRPKERNLYIKETGKTYGCFYKSSSISKFYMTNKIWCEFTINLVFTGNKTK